MQTVKFELRRHRATETRIFVNGKSWTIQANELEAKFYLCGFLRAKFNVSSNAVIGSLRLSKVDGNTLCGELTLSQNELFSYVRKFAGSLMKIVKYSLGNYVQLINNFANSEKSRKELKHQRFDVER